MGTPLNSPNFSASNAQFGSHAASSGAVDRLFDAEKTYKNGEVRAIFMPNAPTAGTAGSCSFSGGTGMALGNLAADTMYEFTGITHVSSSTVEVFVFKN